MKKLSARQYAEVFVEAMTAKNVDQSIVAKNFVGLVAKRRAWKLVPRILQHVQALDDKRHGITRVHMTNADAAAATSLTVAFEKALGAIAVESTTDASLIAGSKVRIGDTLLDTSLAHQLTRLHTHLSQR